MWGFIEKSKQQLKIRQKNPSKVLHVVMWEKSLPYTLIEILYTYMDYGTSTSSPLNVCMHIWEANRGLEEKVKEFTTFI